MRASPSKLFPSRPPPPCFISSHHTFLQLLHPFLTGLFCSRPIPRGTLIHTAPCLLFPLASYESHARHTVLEHYLYNCRNGDRLLALGYGSIFNHHREPTVDYRIEKDKLEIKYYAVRDVDVGEELW